MFQRKPVSGGNPFRTRPYAGPADSQPLRATGVSPSIEESWALRDMAREFGLVLEVGTAWGYSSILMALTGAMVHTIDPHTDHDTLEEFRRNRESFHVEDLISYEVRRSQEALPDLIRRGVLFDAAFIDGDHSYEACRSDLGYALQLVKPRGVLAVHDYTPAWPGVDQACRELLARYEERRVVDTLLLVRLDPSA